MQIGSNNFKAIFANLLQINFSNEYQINFKGQMKLFWVAQKAFCKNFAKKFQTNFKWFSIEIFLDHSKTICKKFANAFELFAKKFANTSEKMVCKLFAEKLICDLYCTFNCIFKHFPVFFRQHCTRCQLRSIVNILPVTFVIV